MNAQDVKHMAHIFVAQAIMEKPEAEREAAIVDALDAVALSAALLRCRGCGNLLDFEHNMNIADGCPCNSPRGVNHGLVPGLTCTCIICDPAQTGSARRTGLLVATSEPPTNQGKGGEER